MARRKKKKSESQLKRLVALDKELGEELGLDIAQFAKQHDISTRTVRRDMKAMRELGCEPVRKGTAWFHETYGEYVFSQNVIFWPDPEPRWQR